MDNPDEKPVESSSVVNNFLEKLKLFPNVKKKEEEEIITPNGTPPREGASGIAFDINEERSEKSAKELKEMLLTKSKEELVDIVFDTSKANAKLLLCTTITAVKLFGDETPLPELFKGTRNVPFSFSEILLYRAAMKNAADRMDALAKKHPKFAIFRDTISDIFN